MEAMNVQSYYPFFKKVALSLILGLLSASYSHMKMNPPSDADKVVLVDNDSCWLASASNMLAGAGYGSGATVEVRADEVEATTMLTNTDIYTDMAVNYGTANSGWTDTALSWWLDSPNNAWATNLCTVVTV